MTEAEELPYPEHEEPNSYMKAPMERYGSAIKELTNPEKILRDFITDLKNERYDKNGNLMYKGEPLMNDKGIYSVVSQITALVNQSAFFSKLNEKEVKALVSDMFAYALVKDLMINRKKYDITNPSSRSVIYFKSIELTYTSLMRAKDGNEKLFWSKIEQNITSTINTQNKQDGMFSKLMNLGKR